MDLPNAHALVVISKVQIQFVVVSNQKINVNQIHAVSVLFVIHHVTPFVTVQNQQLEILTVVVPNQFLHQIFVDQDHVAEMLTVTFQVIENNVSVNQDILVMHTLAVLNHQELFVNQIHVHQVHNVSSHQMEAQCVNVQMVWEVTQQVLLDVTVMNVALMMIVQMISHVWVSDVKIHAQDHAVLVLTVKLKNIIQFVSVIEV